MTGAASTFRLDYAGDNAVSSHGANTRSSRADHKNLESAAEEDQAGSEAESIPQADGDCASHRPRRHHYCANVVVGEAMPCRDVGIDTMRNSLCARGSMHTNKRVVRGSTCEGKDSGLQTSESRRQALDKVMGRMCGEKESCDLGSFSSHEESLCDDIGGQTVDIRGQTVDVTRDGHAEHAHVHTGHHGYSQISRRRRRPVAQSDEAFWHTDGSRRSDVALCQVSKRSKPGSLFCTGTSDLVRGSTQDDRRAAKNRRISKQGRQRPSYGRAVAVKLEEGHATCGSATLTAVSAVSPASQRGADRDMYTSNSRQGDVMLVKSESEERGSPREELVLDLATDELELSTTNTRACCRGQALRDDGVCMQHGDDLYMYHEAPSQCEEVQPIPQVDGDGDGDGDGTMLAHRHLLYSCAGDMPRHCSEAAHGVFQEQTCEADMGYRDLDWCKIQCIPQVDGGDGEREIHQPGLFSAPSSTSSSSISGQKFNGSASESAGCDTVSQRAAGGMVVNSTVGPMMLPALHHHVPTSSSELAQHIVHNINHVNAPLFHHHSSSSNPVQQQPTEQQQQQQHMPASNPLLTAHLKSLLTPQTGRMSPPAPTQSFTQQLQSMLSQSLASASLQPAAGSRGTFVPGSNPFVPGSNPPRAMLPPARGTSDLAPLHQAASSLLQMKGMVQAGAGMLGDRTSVALTSPFMQGNAPGANMITNMAGNFGGFAQMPPQSSSARTHAPPLAGLSSFGSTSTGLGLLALHGSQGQPVPGFAWPEVRPVNVLFDDSKQAASGDRQTSVVPSSPASDTDMKLASRAGNPDPLGRQAPGRQAPGVPGACAAPPNLVRGALDSGIASGYPTESGMAPGIVPGNVGLTGVVAPFSTYGHGAAGIHLGAGGLGVPGKHMGLQGAQDSTVHSSATLRMPRGLDNALSTNMHMPSIPYAGPSVCATTSFQVPRVGAVIGGSGLGFSACPSSASGGASSMSVRMCMCVSIKQRLVN